MEFYDEQANERKTKFTENLKIMRFNCSEQFVVNEEIGQNGTKIFGSLFCNTNDLI